MTTPTWYLRRLSRMGPREVAARVMTAVRVRAWRRPPPDPARRGDILPGRYFVSRLRTDALDAVSADAAREVVVTADRLLDGYAEYFGVVRDDMVDPDWSLDPRTGRRAPGDAYAFDVPYRDEQAVGDVKQLWEPSRHQHLTVLAAAYALTGDDRYAQRVADHLKSWWAANPPLRGVHWTSGIELGIRLLSWVWVRRLLDGWSGAAGLFEDNPEALHQIWHHQRWLAALRSGGSSANNHVIAEDAGQLAASCAFPWFRQSGRWRDESLSALDEQLRANTFESGLNRELATDYHGLVLELGLAAAIEASAAGSPLPESTWDVLLRMTDALAAVVDSTLRPPRQGDSDDGHGLRLDGHGSDRWASLLATGGVLFGRRSWWPAVPTGDLRTAVLTAIPHDLPSVGHRRPVQRPVHFVDAGMAILRTPAADPGEEIWCRCDGGPHGFLSIAAHAHADALSIEVRHGDVDILTDPGTYCYHGDPEWRAYFRSTLGHNTLELGHRDQSTAGGPFLWTRHARSRVLLAPGDRSARWSAEHAGYSRRGRPAIHRRTVELRDTIRKLVVLDEVECTEPQPCRLAFHLGPLVAAELAGSTAELTWSRGDRRWTASLELPDALCWTTHHGRQSPPLGWYSEGFGRKVPATTLVGTGSVNSAHAFRSVLRFAPGEAAS